MEKNELHAVIKYLQKRCLATQQIYKDVDTQAEVKEIYECRRVNIV